jgi:hypothetical protein
MKYVANPVIVDAFKITEIHTTEKGLIILLEDGNGRELDPSMTARYIPKIGDYLVRAEDGYEYLNPKEVFERKYLPMQCS